MATAWPSYDRLVVHFSGGVRGINHFEDNQLYFLPVIRKEHRPYKTLEKFSDIFHLSRYGTIYGMDFYTTIDQIQNLYPPIWESFSYNHGNGFLYYTIRKKLSEIRNAAYCKELYKLHDTLDKISAWTNATARSLRSASDGYHKVLTTICTKNEFEQNKAFEDMNYDAIIDSLHSFLYHAGTLRDHIAEFIVLHIGRGFDRETRKKPRMSKLISKLEESNNDFDIGDIKQYLLDSNDLDAKAEIMPGWLCKLNKYRNIITHEKSLDKIVCRNWMWMLLKQVDNWDIPTIHFPIPSIPIINSDYFKNSPNMPPEKLKRAAASHDFMLNNPDGLEVMWQIFIQLLLLIEKVLQQSPLPPEPILLDRTNSRLIRMTYT